MIKVFTSIFTNHILKRNSTINLMLIQIIHKLRFYNKDLTIYINKLLL